MKRIVTCLNGLKSRCFVLLACLGLFVGTTSCNDDEFETVAPEGRRQYSKAELIEQALSRMPRTRADGSRDIIVTMVTIKDTVSIGCSVNDTVTFNWEGKPSTCQTKGDKAPQVCIFTDNRPSRYITIVGKKESLNSLGLNGCGLILLEMDSNPNLTSLGCGDNHLDELDLTNCPNLQWLYVANNELSSLDVSCLDKLESFDASNNRLRSISFNEHPNMYELFVEDNKLTMLDLSGATGLYMLEAQNNLLKTLNLNGCTSLGYLDISSTPITNLDLSSNMNLWELNLENTSIEVLNKQFVHNESFSVFKELERLNVANTIIQSLDLSSNPRLYVLDISGSTVTRVNLSDNPMLGWLYATRSQLTDLIGEKEHLGNLFEVRIESTPLEKDATKMTDLVVKFLPNRADTYPGHLYTYFVYMNNLLRYTEPKNWLINR